MSGALSRLTLLQALAEVIPRDGLLSTSRIQAALRCRGIHLKRAHLEEVLDYLERTGAVIRSPYGWRQKAPEEVRHE